MGPTVDEISTKNDLPQKLTDLAFWRWSRICLIHGTLQGVDAKRCEISQKCPPRAYRESGSLIPNMRFPTFYGLPFRIIPHIFGVNYPQI